MTITTPAEFRHIGFNDGREMAKDAEPGISMMFSEPGGADNVAYLEGVIAGMRAELFSEDDGEAEELTLSIVRKLEPKEITYMVFGTGALSYPWWGHVEWINVVDGEEFPIDNHAELDIAEPNDVLIITHDGADSSEGAMDMKTRLTFQQIADAAAKAIASGHVYDNDAIKEDLGYCDSEQADAVLQMAVFGRLIFG